MVEYESCLCDISRHAMNIFPNEAERVQMFVRGFNFSIKLYMFRASREVAFLHSIVRTAKDTMFKVLEDFMDSKRVHSP